MPRAAFVMLFAMVVLAVTLLVYRRVDPAISKGGPQAPVWPVLIWATVAMATILALLLWFYRG